MAGLSRLFSDTRRTVPEDLDQIEGGVLTGVLARSLSLSLEGGEAVEYEGLDLPSLNATSQVRLGRELYHPAC